MKKINFVISRNSKYVEKSIKNVLKKTLSEIVGEKKLKYPEDKEAYLQEILQKQVPKVSEDEKS